MAFKVLYRYKARLVDEQELMQFPLEPVGFVIRSDKLLYLPVRICMEIIQKNRKEVNFQAIDADARVVDVMSPHAKWPWPRGVNMRRGSES